MKCVGYDGEFQRTNIDGFAAWKIKKAEAPLTHVSNGSRRKIKKRSRVVKEESVTSGDSVKDDETVQTPAGSGGRPGSIRIRARLL
jgi:hypothetical protein